MAANSHKALVILCIVYFTAKLLITLPICVWSGIELKRHWNAQFIIKRRRGLILLLFMLLCWHSFVDFPYFVIVLTLNGSTALLSEFGAMHIFGLFTRTFTTSLILLRFYLLYFDHNLARILSTKKWQILIDPDIEQTNWFLVNKKQRRFGSASFLTKYCIFPICLLYAGIFVIALIAMHSIHGQLLEDPLGVLFIAVFCVIVGFCAFAIWRKYPKLLDQWGIRKEIGLSVRIFMTFPIVLSVDFILMMLDVIDPAMTISILLISLDQCIAANVFVLVPYVTHKQTNSRTMSYAEKIISSTMSVDTPDVKWQDVCETHDGYEQFANFLEHEFAVENILFITEYIQLKHVLMQKETFRALIENELNLQYEFMVPESVPISLIVKELTELIHNESVKDAMSRAITAFYSKYIDAYTATLEVNINSSSRKQLSAALMHMRTDYENHSEEHIIRVFMPLLENAVEQVSLLLHGSQQRFRASPVFKELTLYNMARTPTTP